MNFAIDFTEYNKALDRLIWSIAELKKWREATQNRGRRVLDFTIPERKAA